MPLATAGAILAASILCHHQAMKLLNEDSAETPTISTPSQPTPPTSSPEPSNSEKIAGISAVTLTSQRKASKCKKPTTGEIIKGIRQIYEASDHASFEHTSDLAEISAEYSFIAPDRGKSVGTCNLELGLTYHIERDPDEEIPVEITFTENGIQRTEQLYFDPNLLKTGKRISL